MFNFIKNQLSKVYTNFTEKIQSLFSAHSVDQSIIEQLEKLLIMADVGASTTNLIINGLQEKIKKGVIKSGVDLKVALNEKLTALLEENKFIHNTEAIYLLVGVNGSGKTTLAAKLAYNLKQRGKRVLLVAADTFRAAAQEQLQQWGQKINVTVYTGKPNQDPASVVFGACQEFINQKYDCLIIDTAGRLQTKINLMKELEKIKRTIERQLPNQQICTLLTLDSMLGQNSLEQAKIFNESTQLSGIVLTKLDGTGKGGIVIGVAQTMKIPIVYIAYGEQIDQLKLFDVHSYVNELLNN